MPILESDRGAPEALALHDASLDRGWRYAELRAAVAELAASLPADRKSLALCLARTDAGTVIGYLAALEAGHAVLPIGADLDPSLLSHLIETYQPEIVLGAPRDLERQGIGAGSAFSELPSPSSLTSIRLRRGSHGGDLDPALCVLLSTSGSTGSPKLVRLSRRNVESNARSIAEALSIESSERAIASLPLFYSFGLSVLHSHLFAGAVTVLTQESLVQRSFWKTFSALKCTSFAGVPTMYEMLRKIGFEKFSLPSLRCLTQAGGRLAESQIDFFARLMADRGGRFFVMYGQTEATARISVLPPDLLPSRLGSVGLPLPGGSIEIRDDEGHLCPTGEIGDVVYRGPNVMQGYAVERSDLAKGDELQGVLETGDLGRVDTDGCLYITGRRKRIGKVHGLRINLDEIEGMLRECGPAAVVEGEDGLAVYCESDHADAFRERVRELAARLKLHPRAFRLQPVDALPLLANGKIDYGKLT